MADDTGSFSIRLTPIQAKVLFNTIDGASDAGSCDDGCTRQELRALEAVMHKLLDSHHKWKDIKLKAPAS